MKEGSECSFSVVLVWQAVVHNKGACKKKHGTLVCAEKLCGAPEPTEFGMNFIQRLCWVASSRLVQGGQLACNCDCLYKLIDSCCAQKYKPFEVAQPGQVCCVAVSHVRMQCVWHAGLSIVRLHSCFTNHSLQLNTVSYGSTSLGWYSSKGLTCSIISSTT